MPRLLLISLVYEPDTVSTATIATRLAHELTALGHEVEVLTSFPHYNPSTEVRGDPRYHGSPFSPIAVEDEGGVRVTRCYIPRKPKIVARRVLDFLVLHVTMFATVLRNRRRYDVAIVISPPLTLALVGLLARALSGSRLVYNVQELWPDVPKEMGVIRNGWILRQLAAMERWIYRSSDHVVAIGPQFAKAIEQRGAEADRVEVIPNFVDTQRIAPRPKANPLANAWGLADARVVLYAGNIGLTQDFEAVLAAASTLAGEGVQFVIVGGGAARPALEQRLQQERPLNVSLRDFVPAEELSDLYGMADVVLVPLKAGYDRSTTPSKIFSAMAACRPIIASAAADTDVAQTITRSRSGIVVPPGEPGALVRAIRSVLDGTHEAWDPHHALDFARQHSPATVAARYDHVVRSLVKGA